MYKVGFSPQWFHGIDIIIDIFSIIVLLSIAFFSLRNYKFNKRNKNYFWFALAFFSLAFSFLFKILTNFTIYYNILNTRTLGFLTFTYRTIATTDILFTIGFLFYMFLSLFGFLILYRVYNKNSGGRTFVLLIYFILAITYFSTSRYFVFHLTSLILLFFVTGAYFRNYFKNKKRNSQFLAISFLVIALSQLFFIFVNMHKVIYAIAELIQLGGYLLLLLSFIGVIKNVKK